MPEFHYHVDHKETIWQRKHVTIEAATQEDADAEIRELAASDNLDEIDADEHEELLDTAVKLEPKDNHGDPTLEILRADSGNTIYNNVTGNVDPNA